MSFHTPKQFRPFSLLGSVLMFLLLSSWMGFAQTSSKATAPAAQAAPSAAPMLLSVNVVHVKPDMLQDWQDIMKNEINPAFKKAGVAWRSIWGTAVFGEGYEYVAVSPINNLAQYDQESPLVRALGQEGATRLGHKYRKCVQGTHTFAVAFRPDLSIVGDPNAEPKLAVITSVHVVAGKGPDFENWLKTEILPAYKKLNVAGYWVHQTVFGGDANEYTILSVVNSFADLDKGPWLNQAVGAEAAQKILSHGSLFVASVERSVSRVVNELSYTTPATKQ